MESKGIERFREEYIGFSDPRTIPIGWDVAAFFGPEQDNLRNYGDVYGATGVVGLSQDTYEQP